MFGRRKKPDGFEWHKYIRTTVRLRREQRRERVLEARRAAAQQAGAAGVALAQGSRAAGVALAQGSRAAGAAAWGGALAGLGAAWLAAQGIGSFVAAAMVAGGRRLAIWARPLVAALAQAQYRRTDCAGRGHCARHGDRPHPRRRLRRRGVDRTGHRRGLAPCLGPHAVQPDGHPPAVLHRTWNLPPRGAHRRSDCRGAWRALPGLRAAAAAILRASRPSSPSSAAPSR